MKPTLYLTNFASPDLHGPGRLLHIMRWAPRWKRVQGYVTALRPAESDLLAYKQHKLSLEDYRDNFEQGLERWDLSPGALMATVMAPGNIARMLPVVDGDTLLCVCARQDSQAGRCHRGWAAPFLVRAGWRVILDGREQR